MKENDVGVLLEEWIKEKKLKKLSDFDVKLLGYETRLSPDILLKPKFAKKQLMIVEVKGSNHNVEHTLGQLLLYHLVFKSVYVALPLQQSGKLKEIRSQIRRRMKGFDFGIMGVSANEVKFL